MSDSHTSSHPVRKVIPGRYTIVLRWRPEDAEGEATWVDWQLCANLTHSADLDQTPEYWKRGEQSQATTKDAGEAETEIEGFVKWDGCTQFVTHQSHAHVDGLENLDDLLGAVRRACKEAYACTTQDGEY